MADTVPAAKVKDLFSHAPKKWFYRKGSEELGPVTGAQLRDLAASDKLGPSDLVRKDGMSEWVAAAGVTGLFPALVAKGKPAASRSGEAGHVKTPISRTEREAGDDEIVEAEAVPEIVEAEAVPPVKTRNEPQPSSSTPTNHDRLEAAITACLKRKLPQDGLFVTPDIPRKKLANARSACKVGPQERIIGLIDCTVFGSAKNCLLFGCGVVYFRNDWSGKSAGASAIPYGDFLNRDFGDGGMQEVALGGATYLNVGGCSISKRGVIEILRSVQDAVRAATGTLSQKPQPDESASAET